MRLMPCCVFREDIDDLDVEVAATHISAPTSGKKFKEKVGDALSGDFAQQRFYRSVPAKALGLYPPTRRCAINKPPRSLLAGRES